MSFTQNFVVISGLTLGIMFLLSFTVSLFFFFNYPVGVFFVCIEIFVACILIVRVARSKKKASTQLPNYRSSWTDVRLDDCPHCDALDV